MNSMSIHFEKTIESWDEALPLGNGDIGCLIWNRSDCLRFSLDKGGIWDCSEPPEEQKDFTYANIRELLQSGRERELHKKYDDCYGKTTPTKLPTGKLILDLGVKENVVSDLSLETAEASLTVGDIRLRSFVHATESYGLIEVGKTGVRLKIENPQYGSPKKPLRQKAFHGTVQTLKNLHYPKAEFFAETQNGTEYQYFIQPTHDRFYGIMTAKTEQSGKTLIAYTVGVGSSPAFIADCRQTVDAALATGYDVSFAAHCRWWAAYHQKSSVTLPDQFLEQQWNLNNYLLGSCSRKEFFPMPLQGVWTADNGSLPPWKGDYHHDLNTQMSYTSYLKANRLEQGECFIDYLLGLTETAQRFARNFYHADGLCLPSVMDIEGHALGGWAQFALSPTNQLWLCQIMARYCYFTKDEDYLRRVYDYMKEVGRFLLSILEEKDGVYKLPLSSSPEIHENSRQAWLTPNSNYDLALMRNFAGDMIRISRMQGDDETAGEWEAHLGKFEPLAVNENGVLMLSPDESPYCSHRHHSHCMAIYPLKTLEYTTEENRRIIDSTIAQLERHGVGEWVGYSVGWMAQLYIAKGEGDKARDLLRDFFTYNCTSNGFHVNGDYQDKTDFNNKCRLFTLEGNFLATDALQDMLLYSEWGKINVFPAVPQDWKEAMFESFRAFGGVLVSSKLENGRISYLKLEAIADCDFTLENDLFHLQPDRLLPDGNDIHLNKGEVLIFS